MNKLQEQWELSGIEQTEIASRMGLTRFSINKMLKDPGRVNPKRIMQLCDIIGMDREIGLKEWTESRIARQQKDIVLDYEEFKRLDLKLDYPPDLKKAYKIVGKTYFEISEATGLAQSSVNRIITRPHNASIVSLIAVCLQLGISKDLASRMFLDFQIKR
jgi:plasmid maintenance system antidote protein VapI